MYQKIHIGLLLVCSFCSDTNILAEVLAVRCKTRPGTLLKSRSTLGLVDKLDRHSPKQTGLLVPHGDRLQTLQVAGAIVKLFNSSILQSHD